MNWFKIFEPEDKFGLQQLHIFPAYTCRMQMSSSLNSDLHCIFYSLTATKMMQDMFKYSGYITLLNSMFCELTD